ncbi:MAG: hypothetical protein ACNS62_18080 [Candidatus Cyclobacteriaceae bacterium M3_2C_046]
MKKHLLIALLLLSHEFILAQPLQDWFIFDPQEDFSSSVIDMSHWLDAPAGKHGSVQIQQDQFTFEDGTPVKFWGVNICSSLPYSDKSTVDQWTKYLAKYGVNAVRFHKFSSHGITGNVSTRIDPDLFDKMDYFHAGLREKGIYYGWSHIYGHKPKPGDQDRLLNYEEVTSTEFPWAHLNGATSSLVNFAPDLQDLNIELTVNMLNHVNPYTGLKYADDPALNFIELQNEDNIFWGAMEASLEQTPTYRKLLCQLFTNWLKQKYGSHQALVAAWNNEGLEPGEHLEKENIYPHPSHSWFSAEYESARRENRPIKQHYLDKGEFLYQTQIKFYKKFIRAIRETGYKGPIVGSCWQAGSGITHFYNLHSDYLAGIIDRHNYYAGGTGHRLVPGKVKNVSMLAKPGSGLLSTGMQMVSDRPFAFSEWMSLVPTEWTAEASPIVAVYGMGLQGWDASYSFASNHPHISRTIDSENHGVYNADSPLQMGLYPALTQMLYRGDVVKGNTITNRKVHFPSLKQGKLGFYETVVQDYDVKSFDGTIPSEALAIGLFPVEFSAEYQETTRPDLKNYWDIDKKIIRSNTGQLEWNYQNQGFFTVNTAGTKALVGFSSGQQKTGHISIGFENPFAVVFINSLDPQKSLEDSNRWLITTVARARNTNMKYNQDKTELIEPGTAPLLMEPVKAIIQLPSVKSGTIHVLDHAGRRTQQQFKIDRSKINLDGAKHQTIYYEVVFD